MNRIREIRPAARIAIVEAGVVLAALHAAAEAEGLKFPVTFGARGSAMIGGILSTNAGGSNVLRYGNTRALCLGLEAVLPGGEVLDLMTELHKDNSGYDLRDLLIGAEGTLGLITAAVLKLVPAPGAYATALVAVPSLDEALRLLNRLQEATGGAVEAFEYMPQSYLAQHRAKFPDFQLPYAEDHEVNILVEVGAIQTRDVTPGPDGAVPIVGFLEDLLWTSAEAGQVLDAVVARNETQRAHMWALREAAAEVGLSRKPVVVNDIAVPVDKVSMFLERMGTRLPEIDAGAETNIVSHLGDGNVHYVVWPKSQDPSVHGQIMEGVEEVVRSHRGAGSRRAGAGAAVKLGQPGDRRLAGPVERGEKRAFGGQPQPVGHRGSPPACRRCACHPRAVRCRWRPAPRRAASPRARSARAAPRRGPAGSARPWPGRCRPPRRPSFFSRVCTLPRNSTTSRSGRRLSSCALRRSDEVPTFAPSGRSASPAAAGETKASRTSSRGR
jgi:FAD/FMN-containing dehydrogenase